LYKRIEKTDFDIYSITFNKKGVDEKLRKNKARLYNYFVKNLIDQINFDNVKNKITIVLDKSKNKEQIKDCNDYLIRNIETKVSLNVEIDILHEDSCVIKQLQLADVFCY
jgi:alpha-L-arabinofuranosidase